MGLVRVCYAGPAVHCSNDEQVCAAEIAEEIREALYAAPDSDDDHRHVWLPNVDRGQPRDFDIEIGTDLPLTPGLLAAEVEWLARAYSNEIDVLRRHYKSVEVQWRVMGWTS